MCVVRQSGRVRVVNVVRVCHAMCVIWYTYAMCVRRNRYSMLMIRNVDLMLMILSSDLMRMFHSVRMIKVDYPEIKPMTMHFRIKMTAPIMAMWRRY